MAKRVSIINFKGGVGKTTLAFHLGTWLAWDDESRVLLVDMDHQSSLSILCLGQQAWDQGPNKSRAVDAIFRPFTGEPCSFPGDDIIVKDPMAALIKDYRTMDIVPSRFELDDVEISLTATHQGDAIQSEWNKRTLMCRWLEETGIDDRYDYIIFDCPPATKIVAQNAIAASHGYIVPVVPEVLMARGTSHLCDLMQRGIDGRLQGLAPLGTPHLTYVPNTKLVGLAVTRIQRARGGYTVDHTRHLQTLQQRWNHSLVTPYIPQGTGVSSALAEGLPVYDFHRTQNVGGRAIDRLYTRLSNELKNRIDAL